MTTSTRTHVSITCEALHRQRESEQQGRGMKKQTADACAIRCCDDGEHLVLSVSKLLLVASCDWRAVHESTRRRSLCSLVFV